VIPYRTVVSLSPEARDLAEWSRDPRILTHSRVLRDTFSPVRVQPRKSVSVDAPQVLS